VLLFVERCRPFKEGINKGGESMFISEQQCPACKSTMQDNHCDVCGWYKGWRDNQEHPLAIALESIYDYRMLMSAHTQPKTRAEQQLLY